VATSISTIYDVLPYNILRNIQLKIYQSEAATSNLNQVLESVLLKIPFHLSGKAFQFLLDIFIFYDFSLNGLIQGFKYLMLEHYSRGNIYALCTAYTDDVEKAIQRLTPSDIGQLRRLLSFRPYVESLASSEDVIAVLTQDDYLKRKLPKLLRDVHEYLFNLHLSLDILRVFVGDLPKSPLGKQVSRRFCTLDKFAIHPDNFEMS
jgi:origin recognition complex subunit 3